MKRKTWIVVGVAGIAAAALLAWALAPRPLPVEVAQADRGLFEETLDEDARTELRDRYIVSAPLAGRLARISLQAGDTVAADAEVAWLTPTLAPLLDDRTRSELSARVLGARSNVQRAASQAEAARASLAQARSDAQRSDALVGQGFVSPTKADADRLAVQVALKTLQAAEASHAMARHELEVAQAASGVAKAGSDEPPQRFALRSPAAGQVLRVLQPSAATVPAGTPLIEVGDLAHLEVVAELLTTDALQARPGSEVRITRWGGDGTLAGRVQRVEPGAFTKVSALGVEEQRVRVHIDLLSPPAERPTLGDGFRVGVSILTRREADALRVPVSAVFPLPPAADGTPGGHAVFVVDQGRARQQPVTLGGRNGRHAWLTDGLQAGAPVIVYPSADVADGVHVAAR